MAREAGRGGADHVPDPENATNRPSSLIATSPISPSPPASLPSGPTLTRRVEVAPGSSNTPSASLSRSATKTSWWVPFVAPASRFVALEAKATKRPSPDIAAVKFALLAFGAEDTWPGTAGLLTTTVRDSPGSSYTPSPSASRSRTNTTGPLLTCPAM